MLIKLLKIIKENNCHFLNCTDCPVDGCWDYYSDPQTVEVAKENIKKIIDGENPSYKNQFERMMKERGLKDRVKALTHGRS